LLGADLHAGVTRAALHRETLRRFVDDWPKLKFEEHEGEGLLPLTDHVGALQESVFARRLARVRPPPRGPSTSPSRGAFVSTSVEPPAAGRAISARLAGAVTTPPPPQAGRYVNTAVWAEGEQDRLVQLEPASARLSPERIYHLELAVGPQDRRVHTLGAAPLPEEAFQWRPDVDGVPLEVAVTGLDCTILGDPVRTLWLPRAGRSESLFFAFRPAARPVVRLRVCVYHRQNLVQSFRIAFLTRIPGRPEPRAAKRRRLLAQALDLPSPTANKARRKPMGKRPVRTRSPRTAVVPDVGFLSRLEYSLGQAEGQWASRPDRTLSIVANDLDGQAVITVKGADVFGVAAPGDLSDYVAGLRTALRDLGTRKFATGEQYRFGLAGDPNRGKPEDLQEGLKTLAERGRELYVQLFSDARLQQAIEQSLTEPGTIHVAHVLVEKVLPWSLLYDREYDANKETDANGNPVGHVVCTAALGEPPDSAVKLECGQHPDCPLHPDRVKARAAAGEPVLLADTVVCPRHFWGFRHLIELPAQQAGPTGAPPPAQQDQISSGQTLNVVAAFHEGLALVQVHAASLEQLFAPPRAALRRASQRDAVMALLDDPQLDLAYFYCHARGGEAEGAASRGFLEVQAGGQVRPGKIAPGDFRRVEWTHHPMVIINGCHSAGFSPRALSPFVRVFMGRQASGVIGTEVDVWEELAGEFVRLFAAEFLRGTPAGKALRQARLALLARNNPLGLAYTLYAAAQLALPGG